MGLTAVIPFDNTILIMKFLPLCLLMLLPCQGAVEPPQLPMEVGTLKLRDGRVFEGTKVTGHDAVGVKIMHSGGTARLPYARLPKDLADKFPRDSLAAKDQLEKEAKAEAVHSRTVDKALAKEAQEEKVDLAAEESPLESVPEGKGDNSAKIYTLETYVARLESGISDAQGKAQEARSRASSYRATAHNSVERVDSLGGVTYIQSTNPSKLRKAEFHERRALKLDGKIREAQHRIAMARDRIKVLETEQVR